MEWYNGKFNSNMWATSSWKNDCSE
jgi:hypothetical protein